MLGRRGHPSAAVRRRIAAGFGLDEAERVVERLQSLGVLDDAAYAVAFVRDRFERAGYGRERIRADLSSRGIGAEHTEAALAAIVDDVRERTCAEQALVRFTRLRSRRKTATRLREAAFRHLIGRGFPADLVRDLLSSSR
jgi:regulatory protein